MQYLLTKEEYDALSATRLAHAEAFRRNLQKFCTEVADNMPIDWTWGDPGAKPWGCILTRPQEWYCDQCPAQKLCPHTDKHWSK